MHSPARRIAMLAALLLVTLAAGCSSPGEDAAPSTPGFTDSTRPVDRSEFELPKPESSGGPTTIPGTGPTLLLPEELRPATTMPTSRTTAPPDTIPSVVPDPGDSTAPCEAFYVVAAAGQDVQLRFKTDSTPDFAAVRSRLVQAFNQATNVLSQRLTEGPDREVSEVLRNRLVEMRSRAEKAQTIEDGSTVFVPLTAEQGPGEPVGWRQIEDHLEKNCSALLRSFVG